VILALGRILGAGVALTRVRRGQAPPGRGTVVVADGARGRERYVVLAEKVRRPDGRPSGLGRRIQEGTWPGRWSGVPDLVAAPPD